tara:strand:- start:295 stop:591 length:297 start_codon:yes stop_codon:yes gene_type:complete
MSWFEILKAKKPDFLDLDGDGDKKEPMSEAADDAKKARGIGGAPTPPRRYPKRGTTLEGGSKQAKLMRCLDEFERNKKKFGMAKAAEIFEECSGMAKA